MLEAIDYKKIFTYFEEISNVPRGSYHNEKISEYLVQFAKDHGFSYQVDDARNVIIKKPACGNTKSRDAVMLQGHMDMVCVSEGVSHDFQNEGLSLRIDGDFISAEGTTLGGDDGIALAYMLALLDGDGYTHPPIEAVFTVDEEVGMHGATALDVSDLEAKTLINLDNEKEGQLLVSCAGGARALVEFDGFREKRSGMFLEVSVSGLAGGHSGTEIDKHPLNASILLGRLLADAYETYPFLLSSFLGGDKDNVITNEATAYLYCEEKAEELAAHLSELAAVLTKELCSQEPDMSVVVMESETKEEFCFDRAFTETVLHFLSLTITGVQVYSRDIPGMVESSLNMGVAQTDESGITLGFALRSQKKSYKMYMISQLRRLAACVAEEGCGHSFRTEGDYPEWDYKRDSRLRELMVREYRECFGEEPVVEGIHAGLECGILSEKIPGLDIVSIGPDIQDIHTVRERMSISSAKRNFDFLLRVLEKL